MARGCGCSGSTCGCSIQGDGTTIVVTGIGTQADPYLVTGLRQTIASQLVVTDTATLDLTLNGSGTLADPYILSGVATAQSDLPPGGTTGQVLAKKTNADLDTEWVDQTGAGTGAVDSVNGQTGVVVLDATDVSALPDTWTPSSGQISDASVVGVALMTAANAAAARTTIGAGTSDVVIGTAAGTAADAGAVEDSFNQAVQYLIWDGSAWPPARPMAALRIFVSTGYPAATAPTGLSLADQWFRDKDAA